MLTHENYDQWGREGEQSGVAVVRYVPVRARVPRYTLCLRAFHTAEGGDQGLYENLDLQQGLFDGGLGERQVCHAMP